MIEKRIAKPAAIPDAITYQGVLYVFAKERGIAGYPVGTYPGNGWTLILGLPEDIALVPARSLGRKLTGVFGFVLVVSALAAWYVSRGITRPLLGLQRAVAELAQGAFGTIAEPGSRDEIGRVTEAFNTMSLRLRDTTVSRDYVAGLIRQMGEALIVTDPAGCILTVNPAALQLLGYTEAELIGQSIERLFAEEDFPRGLPGPRPTEVHETTWRTKHDQRIPVLLTGADLRDQDLNVSIAEDGESAIEQTDYVRPDLILLDVMMPEMDGFTTCRLLKERPATQDIPIIFMTALTTTADKVKGFELGAVDYITKPFQHEEGARARHHPP
ncbi:MAG: response regulator [Gammaproteobacteria bacterium]